MLNANRTAKKLLEDLKSVSLEKEVEMRENDDLKCQLIELDKRKPELQESLRLVLDTMSTPVRVAIQEEPELSLGKAMQAVYEDPVRKEDDTSSLDGVDDPNLPDIYVSEEEIVSTILSKVLHFPFVSEVYYEECKGQKNTEIWLEARLHWITLVLTPISLLITYLLLSRRINKLDTFGRVKIRSLGTTWRDENLFHSHTIKNDQDILDLKKDSYLDREFELIKSEERKKELVSSKVERARKNKVQINEDRVVRTSEIVITGTEIIAQINRESEAYQREYDRVKKYEDALWDKHLYKY